MRNMGFGTIQQRLSRIKGRLRLLRYDWGKSYARRKAQIRAYIETPQGNALMDMVTLVSVGIISFVLGQQSVLKEMPTPVLHDTSARIERMQPLTGGVSITEPMGKVVASRNGKRWHYVWCPGAETISEKNKRYFKSEVDAEKAGYSRAANCK